MLPQPLVSTNVRAPVAAAVRTRATASTPAPRRSGCGHRARRPRPGASTRTERSIPSARRPRRRNPGSRSPRPATVSPADPRRPPSRSRMRARSWDSTPLASAIAAAASQAGMSGRRCGRCSHGPKVAQRTALRTRRAARGNRPDVTGLATMAARRSEYRPAARPAPRPRSGGDVQVVITAEDPAVEAAHRRPPRRPPVLVEGAGWAARPSDRRGAQQDPHRHRRVLDLVAGPSRDRDADDGAAPTAETSTSTPPPSTHRRRLARRSRGHPRELAGPGSVRRRKMPRRRGPGRGARPRRGARRCEADVILLAVGARPRELPALRDGERIMNGPLYDLELPGT